MTTTCECLAKVSYIYYTTIADNIPRQSICRVRTHINNTQLRNTYTSLESSRTKTTASNSYFNNIGGGGPGVGSCSPIPCEAPPTADGTGQDCVNPNASGACFAAFSSKPPLGANVCTIGSGAGISWCPAGTVPAIRETPIDPLPVGKNWGCTLSPSGPVCIQGQGFPGEKYATKAKCQAKCTPPAPAPALK